MKKTITTIFTGLGLLAIALAIYFKKGPCTNTHTCSGQKCCLTDTSERDLFHPGEKETVCKFIDSDFILDANDKSRFQTYYISLENDKNFVVSARVSDTVSIDGETKIKSLEFILMNSEDSFYSISSIDPPKREGDLLFIDLNFEKEQCKTPLIPKSFYYEINDPKAYIGKMDRVRHHHQANDLDDLCDSSNGQMKLRVGGHLCQVSFQFNKE